MQKNRHTVSESDKDSKSSHKSIQSNTATFDALQATVRANKHLTNNLQQQVGELTSKITRMEDCSGRTNVKLVRLKKGKEGSVRRHWLPERESD